MAARKNKLRKMLRTAAKKAKKARRATSKVLKKTKRAVVKTQRRLKKTAKARKTNRRKRMSEARRQERARRRNEQRQEIQGDFDTSAAVVVQANQDRGASRPGEPPKMRKGKGRDSIKAELRLRGKGLVSRVYVDKKIAPYMAMYEFRQDGQQRPFLKPALMNNISLIGQNIGTELKRAVTSKPKQKAVVK